MFLNRPSLVHYSWPHVLEPTITDTLASSHVLSYTFSNTAFLCNFPLPPTLVPMTRGFPSPSGRTRQMARCLRGVCTPTCASRTTCSGRRTARAPRAQHDVFAVGFQDTGSNRKAAFFVCLFDQSVGKENSRLLCYLISGWKDGWEFQSKLNGKPQGNRRGRNECTI